MLCMYMCVLAGGGGGRGIVCFCLYIYFRLYVYVLSDFYFGFFFFSFFFLSLSPLFLQRERGGRLGGGGGGGSREVGRKGRGVNGIVSTEDSEERFDRWRALYSAHQGLVGRGLGWGVEVGRGGGADRWRVLYCGH